MELFSHQNASELQDKRLKLYQEYDNILIQWKKKEIEAFEYAQYITLKEENGLDVTVAENAQYHKLISERHKLEVKAEELNFKIKDAELKLGISGDPFDNKDMLPNYYELDQVGYAKQFSDSLMKNINANNTNAN